MKIIRILSILVLAILSLGNLVIFFVLSERAQATLTKGSTLALMVLLAIILFFCEKRLAVMAESFFRANYPIAWKDYGNIWPVIVALLWADMSIVILYFLCALSASLGLFIAPLVGLISFYELERKLNRRRPCPVVNQKFWLAIDENSSLASMASQYSPQYWGYGWFRHKKTTLPSREVRQFMLVEVLGEKLEEVATEISASGLMIPEAEWAEAFLTTFLPKKYGVIAVADPVFIDWDGGKCYPLIKKDQLIFCSIADLNQHFIYNDRQVYHQKIWLVEIPNNGR